MTPLAKISGLLMLSVLTGVLMLARPAPADAQNVFALAREFPLTDFSKRSVEIGRAHV